jgi:hypothetical protein
MIPSSLSRQFVKGRIPLRAAIPLQNFTMSLYSAGPISWQDCRPGITSLSFSDTYDGGEGRDTGKQPSPVDKFSGWLNGILPFTNCLDSELVYSVSRRVLEVLEEEGNRLVESKGALI